MFTTTALPMEGLKNLIECLQVEFVYELLEVAV